MAELNVGKITQIIGAVLDIKFAEGKLPEINEAIKIATKDGGELVVEVSQHLGDNIVRCIAMGATDGLVRGMDAVVLAVAHSDFSKLTMSEMDRFFGEGQKVLLDLKGLLCRKEYEQAGYSYWRL